MSVANHNEVLDALVLSLANALPQREVQRSLVADPPSESAARLLAGVVCVVSEGGGSFANYRGREGDLGEMKVRLVGFLKVPPNSAPVEVERAELALLGDWLTWVNAAGVPGLDVVYPGDWVQSRQLEHPFGWVTLELVVKT